MVQIKITPLGTVSPYCKGKHNCPGFLAEYKSKKILLDCGSGITGLLNFPEDLKDLSVFISHFHKDHFSDLGLVQYASYVYRSLGMTENEADIYLPYSEYLDNKSAVMKTPEAFVKYHSIDEKAKYTIDDITVSFFENSSHTIPSYAIKLENNSFKIVYTSDTGNPDMDKLAAFSRNADLLICESSFVRSHNAASSTHLHAHEAGELAKKAGADILMLTHFWPETPKSEYSEEAREVFRRTIAAEEGDPVIIER